MWNTLYVLLLVYAFGGCFTFEHPRSPHEGGEQWGIFLCGMIKQLLQSKDFTLVPFLQGPLGQPVSKPTCLLCARLPRAAWRIFSGYQRGWKPSYTLGGRDETGKAWKTAQAKVYPTLLCQAIAAMLVEYDDRCRVTVPTAAPPDLAEAVSALTTWDPYSVDTLGGKMKADYASHLAG